MKFDIRGDWGGEGGGENLLSLTLPLSIHLINHEKKSMRMKADLSYQLVCIFREYYLFIGLFLVFEKLIKLIPGTLTYIKIFF